MDEDQGIVTASITITRTFYPARINPEHTDTIRVDLEGNPSLVDILGMLEFAKMSSIEDIRDCDEDCQ